MPYSLDGPAGRMLLDDDGRLLFERSGRVVLESGAAPVFVLRYSVESPAASLQTVVERTDGLSVVFAATVLEHPIELEAERTDLGFRLLLSANVLDGALGVAWSLRPQGPWFGQGARMVQSWPLDRLPVTADPLLPADGSVDGTLGVVTPLWLNASGAGLLVEEGAGELAMSLDRGGDGLLRILVRADLSVQDEAAPLQGRSGPRLALDVLLADDVRGAFGLAQLLLGHPHSAPPEERFGPPLWSAWTPRGTAVSQRGVLELAEQIAAHGYARAKLELDARWQAAEGALEFDRRAFPDPPALVAELRRLGFGLVLPVTPLLEPGTASWRETAARQLLLRHPLTGEPYLVRRGQRYGALLDVSSPDALAWFRDALKRLQYEYGIDGFAFDAGEGSSVPEDARSSLPMSRRHYADRYVQWVAEHFPYSQVRCGWRSQRCGLLFRQLPKASRWDQVNGLRSVLTQSLALSIAGYPFVLPGTIGGSEDDMSALDGELLVRWTQLAAVLPAMQLGMPPWLLGDEVDAICRRYVDFHADIAPYIHSLVEQATFDGTPVVRPVFWHAPDDEAALMIDDQFLLGDLLLAAPVLKPDRRSRDVYLPAGRWRDRWNGTLFDGPRWLEEYAAPLDILPLFERLGYDMDEPLRHEDTKAA